jgi:Rieske Fe-S protein
MRRRNFLQSALSFVGTGALAALAVVPGSLHLLSPILKKTNKDQDWLDLGPAEDFSEENPVGKVITVRQQDGWQMREQKREVFVIVRGGDPIVFSSLCPHLQCPVSFDSLNSKFQCPCHKSYWDTSGTRLSGPTPRGMDPLPSKVEEGRLFCRWVTFEAGLDQPVEA